RGHSGALLLLHDGEVHESRRKGVRGFRARGDVLDHGDGRLDLGEGGSGANEGEGAKKGSGLELGSHMSVVCSGEGWQGTYTPVPHVGRGKLERGRAFCRKSAGLRQRDRQVEIEDFFSKIRLL